MSGLVVFILWTILFIQLIFKFIKVKGKVREIEPFIFLLVVYVTGAIIGLSLSFSF